ncbi:hypothetical protein KC867_03785 [Candidatus Saccharibacteria bacterium]|nr:hypothetical protein [Candidatus Saccharibacteria bacterium]
MIINSKINNDISSGGNLDLFKDQQRLTLEGHFGDFFDVFMPDQTQSEVLTILSPNSMMYVMQELADYDIEINNNRLYLYTYRHLKITELESLIAKVDRLLAELWLRKEDVRNNNINNAMVARTATYNTAGKRSLKKGVNKIAVLVIVIYVFSYLPENSFSGLGVLVLVICLGVISVKRIFRNALLRRKYERTIGQYKQKNNQQ